MNTRIFTLLLPLLLTIAPSIAQQAEKTLVKSFNLNGHTMIFLDLEGDVDITLWSEPVMRIQMTVTLQNGNENMLKSLVTAGRYNLNTKEENGSLSIVAPGLDRQIKLSSGQNLGEQIKYQVFAPKDITVTTRSTDATGLIGSVDNSF
jgi:hypothetical protein